jgi:hypothetical protein
MVQHTACHNSPCARTTKYISQYMAHTIDGIVRCIESANNEPTFVSISQGFRKTQKS